MKYWVTSDNHFGHKKIRDFCGRPEGYEQLILEDIGDKVRTGDIVINLGDFGWTEIAFWTKHYMCYTNGCKNWLVVGNHDKDKQTTYLNRGWDVVANKLEINYKDKRIVFSHKPQYDDGYDLNIHGHFHNIAEQKWKIIEPHLFDIKNKKQYLISLEDNDYRLESLDDILKRTINV